MTPRRLIRVASLMASGALAGCGHAPSIDIIGSFFPVWMLCLTIAVILTFVARMLLRKFQLETDLGPLALFYPGLATLLTSVLWLIFFR